VEVTDPEIVAYCYSNYEKSVTEVAERFGCPKQRVYDALEADLNRTMRAYHANEEW